MSSSKSDEQAEKKYFQENGALANKLGITNQKELEAIEARYVEKKLLDSLSVKSLEVSKQGLKSIHKEMFGEVYNWAGQFRDYTTGRGIPFCRPEYIDNELDKIYKIVNKDLKSGMSDEKFAKVSAEFVGELNVVHPFVDGNGRTQRQSLRNLARVAEKDIDINKLNKADWYKATEQSHITADNSGFEKIIQSMIVPAKDKQLTFEAHQKAYHSLSVSQKKVADKKMLKKYKGLSTEQKNKLPKAIKKLVIT
ncbi:MAG: Fic/DOC family protein [Ostreibacterium sp.]